MPKIEETTLPGVLVITARMFGDARGRFLESWRSDAYAEAGVGRDFLQDNVSVSVRDTIRGLHFQHPKAQGKLISVLHGTVLDVAVDIRRDSPSFGRWVGVELSEQNGKQLWIPPGFAHGFAVLSDAATLLYKCTAYYAPEHEHVLRWDDPTVAIDWPIASPILSVRDTSAPLLGDLRHDELPCMGDA